MPRVCASVRHNESLLLPYVVDTGTTDSEPCNTEQSNGSLEYSFSHDLCRLGAASGDTTFITCILFVGCAPVFFSVKHHEPAHRTGTLYI